MIPGVLLVNLSFLHVTPFGKMKRADRTDRAKSTGRETIHTIPFKSIRMVYKKSERLPLCKDTLIFFIFRLI